MSLHSDFFCLWRSGAINIENNLTQLWRKATPKSSDSSLATLARRLYASRFFDKMEKIVVQHYRLMLFSFSFTRFVLFMLHSISSLHIAYVRYWKKPWQELETRQLISPCLIFTMFWKISTTILLIELSSKSNFYIKNKRFCESTWLLVHVNSLFISFCKFTWCQI